MHSLLPDNELTVLTGIMHFFLMKNSSVLKPAKQSKERPCVSLCSSLERG